MISASVSNLKAEAVLLQLHLTVVRMVSSTSACLSPGEIRSLTEVVIEMARTFLETAASGTTGFLIKEGSSSRLLKSLKQ